MFVKPRSFGDVVARLDAAFRASALHWGCQRGLPLVHEPWDAAAPRALLHPKDRAGHAFSKDGPTADRWGAVPQIPRVAGSLAIADSLVTLE